MIRVDVEQGSEEWRAARAGVVTASCLDKLLTSKTLKPSSQADGYLCRIVAEKILGAPLEDESYGFMERGHEQEAEAVAWYAFTRGVEPEVVGFLTRDDGRVGCSPDRLVGEDGGLEVKVPAAHTHVGYLIDPASLVAEYRHQVQGCLWITGRAWWDILSYNSKLPPLVVRVEPDEEYLAPMAAAVERLLVRVEEAMERVAPLVSASADDLFLNNPFR